MNISTQELELWDRAGLLSECAKALLVERRKSEERYVGSTARMFTAMIERLVAGEDPKQVVGDWTWHDHKPDVSALVKLRRAHERAVRELQQLKVDRPVGLATSAELRGGSLRVEGVRLERLQPGEEIDVARFASLIEAVHLCKAMLPYGSFYAPLAGEVRRFQCRGCTAAFFVPESDTVQLRMGHDENCWVLKVERATSNCPSAVRDVLHRLHRLAQIEGRPS